MIPEPRVLAQREQTRPSGANEVAASSSFTEVSRASLCPFAAHARLRTAPALDSDDDLGEHLRRVASEVRQFARTAERDGLDGYVVPLPRCRVGVEPRDLALLLRMLLGALHAENSSDAPLDVGIDRPGWRLRIAGLDFFLAVFTPAYGPSHSRYTPGPDTVFLLLQPDSSFHVRLGSRAASIRAGIRRRFALAGRAYRVHELEACRYLPAVAMEDPEPWWKVRGSCREVVS